MKRLILSFVLAAFFIFVIANSVYASFEDDYQNYLKTYDSYRTSHANYLATRNQFLQFGTLTSKNEALTAVKEFLISRDSVLLSYVGLLKQKNQNESLAKTLDSYDAFLNAHQGQVASIGSLEDSLASASEVESQSFFFQLTSQGVIWNIITGQINQLKLRFLVLETEASGLISTLQASGKDVSTLERWLLDARGKRELAEVKLAQTQNLISSLTQGTDSLNTTSIKLLLFESNQYLKEGISYLKELSETIKYGNY